MSNIEITEYKMAWTRNGLERINMILAFDQDGNLYQEFKDYKLEDEREILNAIKAVGCRAEYRSVTGQKVGA